MKFYSFLLLVCCTISGLFAQAPKFSTYTPDYEDIRTLARPVVPNQATFYAIDELVARNFLHAAPDQADFLAGGVSDYILEVPDPVGRPARFKVVSYAMMEPGLSLKFPEIVNLLGIDVDQPTRKIRLDWTYTGLHASVVGDPNGAWYIEPLFKGLKDKYQVYYTRDYPNDPTRNQRECLFDESSGGIINEDDGQEKLLGDCIFRSYRLAVACTGEYYQFHGTTDEVVMSAINTTVNRVNQVMEQDMAVRLVLVANNNILLESDPATDGYSNDDASLLIDESHASITAELGTASFDIGHTFSTGAGGLAGLGVICSTGNKGRGVTGTNSPVGDPYDIDFVAHELGHQFGGNHSFNSTESSCSTRNNGTAYEPGGGTTIQAYAGICGPTANIQQNSDPYYHIISLQEFEAEIASTSCALTVPGVSNLPPTVNAGPDYTIPRGTPFVLTPASAGDQNGDALLYCWEQHDLGPVEAGIPSGNTNGPLFRSLPPTTSSQRYIDGSNPWETLPLISRTIDMRLTVRDVNMTFGCTVSDEMQLTVANAGPFVVTSPNGNEEFGSGTTQTVTWNVAGTGAGTAVNCANVDLEISYDGGSTYSTLLASTPNDGSQSVTMPVVTTSETQVRLRIRCSDNIFYDVSDDNFSIVRQEYTLTAIDGTTAICEGDTEATGLSFSLASQAGYTGTVSYSATLLPGAVTATFSPASPANLTAASNQTVNVTLNNTGALAVGNYIVRITANDGASSKLLNLMLEVGAGGSLNLIAPVEGQEIEIYEFDGFDVVDIVVRIQTPPGPTLNYTVVFSSFSSANFSLDGGFIYTLTITRGVATHNQMESLYIIDQNGLQSCPITVVFIDPSLPVEWLDFTARPRNNQSLLEWNVIQDGQGLNYTVEKRAAADRDFIEAMVLPDSRVSGPATYQFTDTNVRAGATYFYRIRQQDVDGALSYSPIRSISFNGQSGTTAVLVPNPATATTVIITDNNSTATNYVLFDALGRKVLQGQLTGSQTNLDLAQLPKAVYQVVLYGENSREVLRLVKH